MSRVKRTFRVHEPSGSTRTIEAIGRNAWALGELITAGPEGCTPIRHPGPRWSSYVHKLRGMGLDIATIHEEHGGPFHGSHARYLLKSRVESVDDQPAQDHPMSRPMGEHAVAVSP
jgi:hypothetical protein